MLLDTLSLDSKAACAQWWEPSRFVIVVIRHVSQTKGKNAIEHKTANQQEPNQRAIERSSQEFELGTTKNMWDLSHENEFNLSANKELRELSWEKLNVTFTGSSVQSNPFKINYTAAVAVRYFLLPRERELLKGKRSSYSSICTLLLR